MLDNVLLLTLILVILQVACALAALLGTLACASPLWGRCKQRSNQPPTGLSLTRITYLCKLIGIPSLAAFMKLELFRVYDLKFLIKELVKTKRFPVRSNIFRTVQG